MSAQHTPSPWEIERVKNGWAQISATNGQWYEFAKVAVMMDRKPSPSGKANATLIAAAPELLEALEAIVVLFEGASGAGANHWEQFAEYRSAREAIAKAKGGK